MIFLEIIFVLDKIIVQINFALQNLFAWIGVNDENQRFEITGSDA